MGTKRALSGLSCLSVGLLLAGCGSDRSAASPASSGASGEASGGASNANAGGDAGGMTDHDTAGSSGSAAAPSACEEFGHFGTPSLTFTLPAGKPTISYPDVQKSFPDVDWKNLERLYVPAGKYETFELGNLPARAPGGTKLVITNLGGQVQVGPNLGGNFIWSMGGGSNWVLTGRYDPDSKTGDEQFPGHRCGA